MENTVSDGITVVSYPSRFIKFTVFFEQNVEGCLRLPTLPRMVGDSISLRMSVSSPLCVVLVDGAAQFLFWGFVLGMNEH